MKTVPNPPPTLTRPVAIPARYPAPQLAVSSRAAAAIAELRAADEIPTYPIAQADWSARIAADFGAVNSALIWLAQNTRRALNDAAWAEYYAAVGLHEACLSVEVEVGGWRKEVAAIDVTAELTQGAEVAAR